MTAVGVAVGLDLIMGEPPTRIHPVVGIGRYLDVAARNAPPELIELADTVTEMLKVKHISETGVRAERGLDY
jgi:cobalamin biosynthesis protein CobD/CbiB